MSEKFENKVEGLEGGAEKEEKSALEELREKLTPEEQEAVGDLDFALYMGTTGIAETIVTGVLANHPEVVIEVAKQTIMKCLRGARIHKANYILNKYLANEEEFLQSPEMLEEAEDLMAHFFSSNRLVDADVIKDNYLSNHPDIAIKAAKRGLIGRLRVGQLYAADIIKDEYLSEDLEFLQSQEVIDAAKRGMLDSLSKGWVTYALEIRDQYLTNEKEFLQSQKAKDAAQEALSECVSNNSIDDFLKILEAEDFFGITKEELKKDDWRFALTYLKEKVLSDLRKKGFYQNVEYGEIGKHYLEILLPILRHKDIFHFTKEEMDEPEIRDANQLVEIAEFVNQNIESKLINKKYQEQIGPVIKLACFIALEMLDKNGIESMNELTEYDQYIQKLQKIQDIQNDKKNVYKRQQKVLEYIFERVRAGGKEEYDSIDRGKIISDIITDIYPVLEKEIEFSEHYNLPSQGFEVEIFKRTGQRAIRKDWPILKLLDINEDVGERLNVAYEMSTSPSLSTFPQRSTMYLLGLSGFIDQNLSTREKLRAKEGFSMHISTVFPYEIDFDSESDNYREYKNYAFYLGLAYASQGRYLKHEFHQGGGLVADKTESGRLKEIKKEKGEQIEDEQSRNESVFSVKNYASMQSDSRLVEIRTLDINEKNQIIVLFRKQMLDYAFRCAKLPVGDFEKEIGLIWDEFIEGIDNLEKNVKDVRTQQILQIKKVVLENEGIINMSDEDFYKNQKLIRNMISKYALKIWRILRKDWSVKN